MNKFIIILISILIYPLLAPSQIPDPKREIRTPDYFERFERDRVIEEIRAEIGDILSDINYFSVEWIDGEHLYYMDEQRSLYDIPRHIYYRLVFKESLFGKFILSPVGARGYMQVMPSTFKWIEERYDLGISDIDDPYDNIRAGTFYLSLMKEWIDLQYPDESEEYRWKRALASYNAGFSVHHRAMYRFNETINYVAFILANNY